MRCIECEAKQLFDKIFVTYNDKLSAFDQFELFQYAISLNQRLMIKDLIEYLELSEIQYRLLYVQYATKFNRIDPAFFLHPRFNGLSWGQKKEFLQFLFKKIPITHISYAMMFMKDAISEDDIFGEGEELGLFSSFIFERSFEGLYVLKHSPHLDQKRWDEFFEFMLLSRNYFQVVKFKLEDEHHFTADQVQNLFQMLENKTITPAQKAFVLEIFEQEKKADIKLIEKFFSLSLPKI